MHLDNEAIRILPIYLRYEKKHTPLLSFILRLGLCLLTSVVGLSLLQYLFHLPFPIWEVNVLSVVTCLGVVLLMVGIIHLVYFIKSKSPEELMRDQFSMDAEYLKELNPFSKAARLHFLQYIRHDWDVREATIKVNCAIIIALGGLLSAALQWVGRSKVPFIFFIVVLVAVYIEFTRRQRIIAQSKRFGYLLEKEGDAEIPGSEPVVK